MTSPNDLYFHSQGGAPPHIEAVVWKDEACYLLDQTALPHTENYLRCDTAQTIVDCIRALKVRGAPAIGIAGAYGVVLAAKEVLTLPSSERATAFERALQALSQARPTAVNLKWAIDRMRTICRGEEFTEGTVKKLLEESRLIHDEDARANANLSSHGAKLLSEGHILTYCNTGALATGGQGTALGVIWEGYRQKKVDHVFACETRPLLQGLRLTAWELKRLGIPHSVICDNMAASVMRSHPIRAVIVGADRIAANGDTANKIGTYGLAILARHHEVPFYVAAPLSSFDLRAKSGAEIPIEERSPHEVHAILGEGDFTPSVKNPAFDVTPHDLISAIICEAGVLTPPFSEKLQRLRKR